MIISKKPTFVEHFEIDFFKFELISATNISAIYTIDLKPGISLDICDFGIYFEDSITFKPILELLFHNIILDMHYYFVVDEDNNNNAYVLFTFTSMQEYLQMHKFTKDNKIMISDSFKPIQIKNISNYPLLIEIYKSSENFFNQLFYTNIFIGGINSLNINSIEFSDLISTNILPIIESELKLNIEEDMNLLYDIHCISNACINGISIEVSFFLKGIEDNVILNINESNLIVEKRTNLAVESHKDLSASDIIKYFYNSKGILLHHIKTLDCHYLSSNKNKSIISYTFKTIIMNLFNEKIELNDSDVDIINYQPLQSKLENLNIFISDKKYLKSYPIAGFFNCSIYSEEIIIKNIYNKLVKNAHVKKIIRNTTFEKVCIINNIEYFILKK